MRKIQDSKFKIQIYKLNALFLVFCIFLLPGTLYSKDVVILAKKITQDIPVDPGAGVWVTAKEVAIPLAPQVMARPRNYEASVKEVSLRALHNGRDIAFLLEWKDDTRDAALENVHTFSDGAALQFPSENTGMMPHFGMGHDEGVVNIWNWKAVSQDGAVRKLVYAMVDDHLAGVEAGNPVSIQKMPVQNLIAGGFGSLTALEEKSKNVAGIGKWDAGKWKVVFKRSVKGTEKYEAQFEEGKLTPVAIAVWDGSKGERGARKTVSTWYYVGLEKETPSTVYIYPIFAFIGTSVVLGGLIVYIRKRRAE